MRETLLGHKSTWIVQLSFLVLIPVQGLVPRRGINSSLKHVSETRECPVMVLAH